MTLELVKIDLCSFFIIPIYFQSHYCFNKEGNSDIFLLHKVIQ